MEKKATNKEKFKQLWLSPLLLHARTTQKIVYIAVVATLLIVTNIYSIPISHSAQISLTTAVSLIAGIILGPAFGFVASFLGDAVAYLVNPPPFPYMFWIGLASATMSLISGLIMNGFKTKTTFGLMLKLVCICLVSLVVSSIGINTTGLYLYQYYAGFWKGPIEYFTQNYGGQATFLAYLLYRMIIELQLVYNVINYIVFITVVPLLNSIKALKINIS